MSCSVTGKARRTVIFSAEKPASLAAVLAVTLAFPAMPATELIGLVVAMETKCKSASLIISTKAEAIPYITLYASFLLTPGGCLVLLLQHSNPVL